MLAGIIGDTLGSVYEGGQWAHKNLPLVQTPRDPSFVPILSKPDWVRQDPCWTDDTLCALALFNAIDQGVDPQAELIRLCRKYGDANVGFGKAFRAWVFSDNPQPYGSSGNGAIMRLGFLPYLPLDLAHKIELGLKLTNLTHGHPDCIAACVDFITLTDSLRNFPTNSKFILQNYLKNVGWSKSVQRMHEDSLFVREALPTLYQAAAIVAESCSMDEVYINSFYVGGDSDTLACISGYLAEQFMAPSQESEVFALDILKKSPELFGILQNFLNKHYARVESIKD